MRRVRIFTAILLALLWVPAVNSCAIAWAFPELGLNCCNDEDGSDGAGDMSCDRCAALEDGFQLNHLEPLALNAPLFVPLESVWPEIIIALAAETADEPPSALWEAPPPEQSLWHFVARTALPVRGPSFV